jgi:hypothetical protein
MTNESQRQTGAGLAAAPGSADGDAGAIALLRCLPTRELEAAYRLAKADETDKGQHSACLIGRELKRRASPPNEKLSAVMRNCR